MSYRWPDIYLDHCPFKCKNSNNELELECELHFIRCVNSRVFLNEMIDQIKKLCNIFDHIDNYETKYDSEIINVIKY